MKYINLANAWYGYENTPVALVENGVDFDIDWMSFTGKVVDKADSLGFTAEDKPYEESVAMYRRILSSMPDNSATIVSVGFSTNLARLLDSAPDDYSALDGKALVKKKVKLLSMMAGGFTSPEATEFNVVQDIPAARKVFEEWPGKIVVSPFELGDAVLFPCRDFPEIPDGKPSFISESCRNFFGPDFDRQTWDITSMCYALGGENFFTESEPVKVSVTEAGNTIAEPCEDGNVTILSVTDEQAKALAEYFVSVIKDCKPKKYQ